VTTSNGSFGRFVSTVFLGVQFDRPRSAYFAAVAAAAAAMRQWWCTRAGPDRRVALADRRRRAHRKQ